eukprot:TRINITY_DN493_c0_g1_i1.p1 TRINITY_DN493_c0_g1~~TRINITY_DN493_c0_g1_i1.p1  ORF type:complete len:160 (-),score=44.89 TRINITY_DN493_c0_g1_i1:37-516(-)
MTDDYSEVVEIIRNFISLGPIGRQMAIGGLNELRGENILEGGSSSGSGERKTTSSGGKGGKPFDLKWGNKHGGQIEVSPDGKTMYTPDSYVSWNCILSEQKFESGVHYIEVFLDKTNGDFFYGVGNPEELPWDGCIGGNQQHQTKKVMLYLEKLKWKMD